MKKELYGTPEMVKNYRENHRTPGGELPDFIETLKLMQEDGALSTEAVPQPELNWKMSRQQFMEAYDRVPFNASRILKIAERKKGTKQEGAMFQQGRDIVCVQHIHDFGYRDQPIANFFAITYMFQGKCNYIFEKDPVQITAGDLMIVTPRFVHQTHTFPDSFAFETLIDESSFNIVFNDFLASSSRLSDFFSNAIISERGNYCIFRGMEDDDELPRYLQSLASACSSEDTYANTCAVSLMKLFLGRAFQKYGETMELYWDDFHKRRMDAEAIHKYISNNYMSITLEQTAEYFHYNKSYLSRYIHAHFKHSFSEIITQLKIDHAREYLKNTDKHIMDIALLVGYDSADHFTRMFRKYTGMSPVAYRKKVKDPFQ